MTLTPEAHDEVTFDREDTDSVIVLVRDEEAVVDSVKVNSSGTEGLLLLCRRKSKLGG